MEPNIKLNENALEEEQGYSVELGGQHFTQAQWEALSPYIQNQIEQALTEYEQHGEEMRRLEQFGHKPQRQVRAFHEGMLQPIGDGPRPLPADRIPVRIELIREEFMDELVPALGAVPGWTGGYDVVGPQNVVEVADAAIDILYVVYGLLVEMGIDAEPLFDEVQASNMSKFGEDGQPIIAGPNDPDGVFEGRVKKGPNYFKPDLARVLREQGWQG